MRQSDDPHFIIRSFRIVDESADWIVVDKPPHLVIHPSRPDGPYTLWDGLKEVLAYEIATGGQISIINRLDRETSGLVLIAKNSSSARLLGKAMMSKLIKKEYLTLVHGHPSWTSYSLNAPLIRKGEVTTSPIYVKQTVHVSGIEAITSFSVLEKYTDSTGNPYSLLRATPITGRTHQIRVHCAYLGFPVVGDKIYGTDEACYLEFIDTGWTPSLATRLLLSRHALHSESLHFPEENLSWKSPWPDDLSKFTNSLICSHG